MAVTPPPTKPNNSAPSTTTTPPDGTENTALSNSVVSGTDSNGWEESDTASVSGANVSTAGGTVSYAVYSDDTCSVQIASAGTVSVNSDSVPRSNAVKFTKPAGPIIGKRSIRVIPPMGRLRLPAPSTEFMSSVDTMKETRDTHSLTCDAPGGSDVCSPSSQGWVSSSAN